MAPPAPRDVVPDLHGKENELDPLLPVKEGKLTEETLDEWKSKVLIPTLRQMMFVAGETAEPSIQTTNMIEEIVRAQVVHVVSDLRQIGVGNAQKGC